MLKKKWLLKEIDKARVLEISKTFGVSPLTSIVLYNRGIRDDKAIQNFLSKDQAALHDPFLMRDMDKAVERIAAAKEANEKITIYGDYDVDGICSSYILTKGFQMLGAQVDTAIPHRIHDGYGLNEHRRGEAGRRWHDRHL